MAERERETEREGPRRRDEMNPSTVVPQPPHQDQLVFTSLQLGKSRQLYWRTEYMQHSTPCCLRYLSRLKVCIPLIPLPTRRDDGKFTSTVLKLSKQAQYENKHESVKIMLWWLRQSRTSKPNQSADCQDPPSHFSLFLSQDQEMFDLGRCKNADQRLLSRLSVETACSLQENDEKKKIIITVSLSGFRVSVNIQEWRLLMNQFQSLALTWDPNCFRHCE